MDVPSLGEGACPRGKSYSRCSFWSLEQQWRVRQKRGNWGERRSTWQGLWAFGCTREAEPPVPRTLPGVATESFKIREGSRTVGAGRVQQPGVPPAAGAGGQARVRPGAGGAPALPGDPKAGGSRDSPDRALSSPARPGSQPCAARVRARPLAQVDGASRVWPGRTPPSGRGDQSLGILGGRGSSGAVWGQMEPRPSERLRSDPSPPGHSRPPRRRA